MAMLGRAGKDVKKEGSWMPLVSLVPLGHAWGGAIPTCPPISWREDQIIKTAMHPKRE